MRPTSLLLPLCLFLSLGAAAQGIQTEFGKNRVQYGRDFDEWVFYESQNFITYWYGEGRMVGQAASMIAEAEHDDIQRLLEHRVNDKIEIIVYVDLSDLKQSNIGTEDAFTNATGRTKIFGNKIFVYFNGSHADLRRQIREGIAGVYLESMMLGANLQEYVQNSILFNMPAWFRDGLIAYAGAGWDTQADDRLRTLFANPRLGDFEDFLKEDPVLAGRAFWHYLSLQYGRAAVANILYIARIYRDVGEGMLYVLGTPYPTVAEGWYNHFRERYDSERSQFDPEPSERIALRNRRNDPLTRLAVCPDGKRLAYVLNRIGRVRVYVQDLESGKRKKAFGYGFRNGIQETDYQYPHIAWHPSGRILAVLYERRDKLHLVQLDLDTGKEEHQVLAPIYQRVYSMHYYDNQRLLLTGATSGLSDVMLYHIPTRQSERVTQDLWDETDARPFTFRGSKGILFLSNRPEPVLAQEKLDSVLPVGKPDLFFLDHEAKSGRLVRVSRTPAAAESQPEMLDAKWFTWLSDMSGVNNRYIGYLDSVIIRTDRMYRLPGGELLRISGDSTDLVPAPEQADSSWTVPVWDIWAFGYPAGNAGTHILLQSFGAGASRGAELRRVGDRYTLYPVALDTARLVRPARTRLMAPAAPKKAAPPVPETPALAHPPKDTVVYYFRSRFDYPAHELGRIAGQDREKPEGEADKAEEAETMRPEDSAGILLPLPPQADSTLPKPGMERFVTSRIIPSRLRFRLDEVTNRFDNSLLFGGLDNFAGRRFLNLDESGPRFVPPPTGLLVKAVVKDLFEDYVLEGGFRLPTNFRGSEFFLTFADRKHRWDKVYGIYRGDWSSVFELNANVFAAPSYLLPPGLGGPGTPPQFKVRMQSTIGQVQWRYPLDIFRSLRLRTTLRNDRYFWSALETSTLAFPAVNEQRLGLRAEYVFDNTLPIAINTLNGLRANFYAEAMHGFRLQPDPFAFDLDRGSTGVVGADVRWYLPLLKHSVLALRFNGASSFGRQRMLFYLGGVDNWLLPRFNTDIPVPGNDYIFQTLAANLRGFRYNIRNGSSFVLGNAELRVPLFRHLFPRTKSNFFRNMQLTGFFDAGTAWEGLSPWSDENPLNIITLENPPSVLLKVKYFRDPLVAGYGVGLRTVLFGYLVKLDYAWGIETRKVQDPILYLSMGLDF